MSFTLSKLALPQRQTGCHQLASECCPRDAALSAGCLQVGYMMFGLVSAEAAHYLLVAMLHEVSMGTSSLPEQFRPSGYKGRL